MAPEPTPKLQPRAKIYAIVVGIVIAGAIITWLAFGFGIQEKHVDDPVGGLELVPGNDRTSKPSGH